MQIVILENVRSLHNVGSIWRTADGLGMTEIWLVGQTGTPPHKDISKTALGAEKIVKWQYFPDIKTAITAAQNLKCAIYSLEITATSQNILQAKTAANWALIVGHEITGVSAEALEKSEKIWHIEMRGQKESLNVSVATGIALFALTNPR